MTLPYRTSRLLRSACACLVLLGTVSVAAAAGYHYRLPLAPGLLSPGNNGAAGGSSPGDTTSPSEPSTPATPQPQVTAYGGPFAYSATELGSSAMAKTLFLVNDGTVTVNPVVSVSGGDGSFLVTQNCPTIAVKGSCSEQVYFAPTSAGFKTATLTVSADGGANPSTYTLSGKGGLSTIQLPDRVDIRLPSGGTGTWVPVAVTNTGTGPTERLTPSVTVDYPYTEYGHFEIDNHCPASLAAGANCEFFVRYVYTHATPVGIGGWVYINVDTERGQYRVNTSVNIY